MQSIDLERALAAHPFCQGLKKEFIAIVARCAVVRNADTNQIICQEGEDARYLYLLLSGGASLDTFIPGRGVVTLQTIGAMESFGWSSLFPPYRWHFTVRIMQSSELAMLDAEALRAQAETRPEFGYELMKRASALLVHRLHAARLQLLEFYHASDLVPG